ncbi:MAG: hypothetical protein M3076_16620 [Actinomycetota bacterium]|nr:hypothetical protein [Actinomycetota bacterium]
MSQSRRSTRALLTATRVWLPLGIGIAGIALIVAGQGRVGGGNVLNDSLAAVGVALIITALIVWMINWMFRMSVQSNREREREEEAREFFTAHGHWPDEEDSQ